MVDGEISSTLAFAGFKAGLSNSSQLLTHFCSLPYFKFRLKDSRITYVKILTSVLL